MLGVHAWEPGFESAVEEAYGQMDHEDLLTGESSWNSPVEETLLQNKKRKVVGEW